MTDYYALLKVDRSASAAEIRQAYRRMAILLHPDKNPHPDATEGFRAITEAWEVLGDPFKKALYDQMLNEEEVVQRQTHRDPAYRRSYRPRYSKPEPSPYLFLYRYSIWVVWFSLLFVIFLSVDYLLPETVLQDEVIRDQRTLHHHTLYTEQGRSFDVSYPQNKFFHREPEITIRVSPLLGFLKGIETRSGTFKLGNLPSLYMNFAFAPVIMGLLALAALLVMDRNGEAQFNASIVLVLLMLLNMIFFVWSKW